MTASNLKPLSPLRFETRQSDGTRIRPGDHKGQPEDAPFVEIEISTIERALNDCLANTNGFVREVARMLGLDDSVLNLVPHAQGAFPKQVDVDKTCDGAFIGIKRAAEATLPVVNRVRKADPELLEMRAMFRQYVQLLRMVRVHVDCAPGLYLAARWVECYWQFTNARAGDLEKVAALTRWKHELQQAVRLNEAARSNASARVALRRV